MNAPIIIANKINNIKILHPFNINKPFVCGFKKHFIVQRLIGFESSLSNLYIILYLSLFSFKNELNFNYISHSHSIY